MAPVVLALRRRGVSHLICYTNQHQTALMSDVFFEVLDYQPDWRLDGVFEPGRCLDSLVGVFRAGNVTDVVVQGDTTSSLVGALAGMYVGARITHLEAGLRSFDPEMLEERHRRAVDHIAHELLTYTDAQSSQLRVECVRGHITRVGNPMVDVTHQLTPGVDARTREWTDDFMYVTLHRKEFTDHPQRMAGVFKVISDAATLMKLDVVYPVHPRTWDCVQRAKIEWPFQRVRPPLGLVESLARVRAASLVVTDSGGIQEEAAIYGTPCVTVRENTERPETVEAGLNVVTGFDPTRIVDAILEARARPKAPNALYGVPGVGRRVVDVLLKHG